MPITDYSTSAASNTVLGTIPVGPGMERNKVNDAIQQLMADIAAIPDDNGSDLIGFLQAGAGTDARTLQSKLQEIPSLLDFIPATEHAGILARTSTYDCSADIAAALTVYDHIYVPEGRYIIGAMVEIGAGGIGQVGLTCAAGVEFRRLDTSITTPLFWLKSDDTFLRGSGIGASRISTAARCPDGIVLIGHRSMTASHTDVMNCELSGFRITGPINYGQTTGNPDVAVKVCNPQLTGLASYYHRICNLRLQAANYGLHLQGFANGNFIQNIEGWYIGNTTLSSHRAFVFFDGAQQNSLFGCFFHYSPGSDCFKFRDNDNTAQPTGFLHSPVFNMLYGQSEQDPAGLSGYGIDAPDASCTGIYNSIFLHDNIASNNIGTNFSINNNISLNETKTLRGNLKLKNTLNALGCVARGQPTLPTTETTLSMGVDTITLRGVLKAIQDGVAWRDLEYQADTHRFFDNGAACATIDGTGIDLPAGDVLKVNGTQVVGAQGAAVADATGAGDVVAQLNALLARLRAHGLIAT